MAAASCLCLASILPAVGQDAGRRPPLARTTDALSTLPPPPQAPVQVVTEQEERKKPARKEDDSPFGSGLLGQFAQGDIDATADNLEFVGNNIIGVGHVVLRSRDTKITCAKAIVDTVTRDFEATGDVRLTRRTRTETEILPWELKKLQADPDNLVTVEGTVIEPSGLEKLQVTIVTSQAVWRGERVVGNLTTGIFNFDQFRGKYNFFYLEGTDAERFADQTVTVHQPRLTTCEYLLDEHEHYSITASRVRLIPKQADQRTKYYSDRGHYHLHAYNCVFWIGNVPVLWLPYIYKPAEESAWSWQFIGGQDSDWGYYLLTTKRLRISDYPDVRTKFFFDIYSKRGIAVGNEIKMRTQDSYTESFVYGMHDMDPDDRSGRFDIPSERYDLRLSHRHHLTPRMDFRGHIEKISDPNFLEDFFEGSARQNPQPATFADLEYQFDRLTLSAYVHPRINDFDTVVERLPELRLDVPRQELFGGLLYQGESSYANLRMKWRDYDRRRTRGNGVDPRDYSAARFDTLHMFYYPFELMDWLNLIPRAGMRLTYYARTSETDIRPDDLKTILTVDTLDGEPGGDVRNYDGTKHNRLRVTGEFGLEANTKFYRSWHGAKNATLELDGIRHVIVPYMNYNYIPEPNVHRDELYYFDDIDRITEQNFVRVGWKNRLQTRRGGWDKQHIYNWATLENYFDFHFNRENGVKTRHLGDFGTILSFTPFPELTVNSRLLVGPADGINRFDAGVEWEFRRDWRLFANYIFQNDYTQRVPYSMGSSLSEINSGSAFARSYGRSQQIRGGLRFPINEKTRGEFALGYDFEDQAVIDSRIRLIRTLHCWEAAIEYGLRQRRNDNGDRENNHTVMFTMSLTDLPSVKIQARQNRTTGGDDGDEGGDGGGDE